MSDEGIDPVALRDSVREVLDAEWPADRLIRHYDEGSTFDAGLWAQATELGWTALGVPEAYGGLGLGVSALGVVYQELGRVCAPIPLASCALAADLIARAGDETQKSAWLPALAAGDLRVAVSGALGDPSIILDGADADLILLRQQDGSHLVLEPRDMRRISATDQTRSLAKVITSRPDGPRLPPAEPAPIIVHAAVAMGCDALGGAEAILERTIGYLKEREQFGRLIGSFQGLKHRVADHQARLVAGRVLMEDVLGGPTLLRACATRAWLCEIYAEVARDAVQLHGGIGYTWDYPCHPWLKRAKLDAYALGAVADHYDKVAALLRHGAEAA
jgi:alkylation response protein AidB-like acyl-CoA dehydrogenase